jgi:lysophospholipase L1-like esterase
VFVVLFYAVGRGGTSPLGALRVAGDDLGDDGADAIPPTPAATKMRGPRRIALVGDSLTEGYTCDEYGTGLNRKSPEGVFLPYGRVVRKAHPDWIVDIFGNSGEKTKRIVERLRVIVDRDEGFDVVVLLGGTNDLGDRNPGECLSNLREAAAIIKASGALPVLVSIPPVYGGDSFEEPSWVTGNRGLINDGLADVMDALYFDLERAVLAHRKPRALYCPDGVHFSPEMTHLVGQAMSEAIEIALNLHDGEDDEE